MLSLASHGRLLLLLFLLPLFLLQLLLLLLFLLLFLPLLLLQSLPVIIIQNMSLDGGNGGSSSSGGGGCDSGIQNPVLTLLSMLATFAFQAVDADCDSGNWSLKRA